MYQSSWFNIVARCLFSPVMKCNKHNACDNLIKCLRFDMLCQYYYFSSKICVYLFFIVIVYLSRKMFHNNMIFKMLNITLTRSLVIYLNIFVNIKIWWRLNCMPERLWKREVKLTLKYIFNTMTFYVICLPFWFKNL